MVPDALYGVPEMMDTPPIRVTMFFVCLSLKSQALFYCSKSLGRVI